MSVPNRSLPGRGIRLPGAPSWEERPVLHTDLDALDRWDFESYYERRYGHPLADAAVDYEQRLQNLKLAAKNEEGGLHPTALGLLMFSTRPSAYVPGAYVDIALYHGTEPDAAYQKDARVIEGPIPRQIEQTLDYLRVSPLVPVPATKDDCGRLDQPVYSLRALQEAVVNAIVHRDYSIQGAQVRVSLFFDRIVVSSPGRLHNSLTRADLFAGCQPVRRNQMLAGFLRDYVSPLTNRGYMGGRAEGFLNMVRECERVSGKPPDLAVVGDSVRLTIHSRAPGLYCRPPAMDLD